MSLRNGFTLGSWTIYPLEGKFEQGDESRRVQPKTMDVLLCLAEASGEVVERDTLLKQIWGERAVSDEPLTRCISELRRALGESRGNPEYILTIPKRGYRLIKPAIPMPGSEPADDAAEAAAARKAKHLGTIRKLAIGLAVLVLGALIQVYIERAVDRPASGEATEPVASATPFRSVAVLPFADMTAEQDQAYFGDGLSEEIINLLAKNPSLRVAARTSSFSYRDSETPVAEIARELGVSHVVEGSVRRDGDQIRVTAQLISADDGYHVWSETYDEPFGEIFSVQDRIAVQITATLEVSVLAEQSYSTRTDPQTYALYLQAKYRARDGSGEALEEAVAYLEEALGIDPSYAPGWAALANAYIGLAAQGHWDWDEGFARARNVAERAVEEDPGYAGGYQQLAFIAHRHDGDLDAAFGHMQKALDLDATDTDTLRNAAVLLLQAGHLGKATVAFEYCARRSPLDSRSRYNLGVAYKYAGRYEEAEAQFRRILVMNPEYNGAVYQLAETLLLSGRAGESAPYWERLSEHRPIVGRAMVAYAQGRHGDSDAALGELIAGWGERWPDVIVDVYAWRGDLDQAFAYMDKDLDKYGPGGYGEVKLQPLLNKLHNDPRWDDFMERAGASDEQLSKYDLEFELPAE